MTLDKLMPLLTDKWVLLSFGILAGLLTIWVARRARKLARSERPDEPLSNLGMLIGLGWSSEAVWILTGKGGADLPTPVRIVLFAVFEVILLVFMIRAKRNVRLIGHPGRSGRNAWIVAAGMSLVAVTTAHNIGEAFLRLLVPLLLTNMWWDGLVGESRQRLSGASSWRWTPRRLLLWLGAIEPGERDIETVHRERLTQQMTQLEFRRRHGSDKQKDRAARRLSRLSLTADDAVIEAVRARVDRARWFEMQSVLDKVSTEASAAESISDLDQESEDEPFPDPWLYSVPIGPLPERGDKVSDNVSTAKVPARKRPPSSRDRVVSAHGRTPKASDAELAARLDLSVKTIERYRPVKVSDNLTDSEPLTASETVNGRQPELQASR